jgi:hypothetical protein
MRETIVSFWRSASGGDSWRVAVCLQREVVVGLFVMNSCSVFMSCQRLDKLVLAGHAPLAHNGSTAGGQLQLPPARAGSKLARLAEAGAIATLCSRSLWFCTVFLLRPLHSSVQHAGSSAKHVCPCLIHA